MRNPFTNQLRKRTKRSTPRKRRSDFSSTPLERVFSQHVLQGVGFFANVTHLFLLLSVRFIASNNVSAALNLLNRSRLSDYMTHALINVELLVGNVHINLDTYRLFTMTMSVSRINDFKNDDHCES